MCLFYFYIYLLGRRENQYEQTINGIESIEKFKRLNSESNMKILQESLKEANEGRFISKSLEELKEMEQ